MPGADSGAAPRPARGATTAVGEITVAAYAPFTRGPEDPYVARLARRRRPRPRRRGLGGRRPDDGTDALLGSVTHLPAGLPLARARRATARASSGCSSVAPAAQRLGVGEALVGLCLDRARTTASAAVVISSLRADGRRAPALRPARLRARPRARLGAGPGRPAHRLPTRPGGLTDGAPPRDRDPELHRDRRRHRGRARLGQPARAGHAAPAGLVRGARPAPRSSRRWPTGATSVGTRVELEHRARQRGRPGASRSTASASYVDGRLHRFTVAARHARGRAGKVVATGEITRVVVDAERFLSRL